MSVWDNPELRVGGDFVKFDNVGDSVAGTITAIRPHRWDDGSVCPQIFLATDDGEEKTITAGQIKLKNLLAEQRPETGDHITISLTDTEKRAGGKTLKHFTLEVRRGTGTTSGASSAPPPAAAAAPASPAATSETRPDPEAVKAALAALSPEERAAMGLPAA